MKNNWTPIKLGEVASVQSGFAFKSKDMGEFGAPIIKIKNINPPNVDVFDVQRVPHQIIQANNRISRFELSKGDILIAMTGATVGKVGRMPQTQETCYLNQRVGKVYLNDQSRCDYNFLYYVLSQEKNVKQMFGIADGSAQANISGTQIERIELPLPPLTEQKAIAHILGSLDDKIELNRRMNETMEAMAQALFKSWFIDFDPVIDNILLNNRNQNQPSPPAPLPEVEGSLTDWDNERIFDGIPDELRERAEIRRGILAKNQKGEARRVKGENDPDSSPFTLYHSHFPSEFEHTEEMGWIPMGWKVSTVGEEVEIVGGGTPSTKDESYWTLGMHAFCTPKDMSTLPTKVLLNTERLLTDKGVAKVSSGQLPSGTVLMSSRAPIGYLAIADVPVTVNQGIIAMLKQERFSEVFLLCWASCNMDKIMARANGSTFLEISKKNFRTIPFLLPDDDIRKAFNRQTDTITKRLISCTRNMKELSAIRDTLLPQLLSGEIRVPEAEKLVEDLDRNGGGNGKS